MLLEPACSSLGMGAVIPDEKGESSRAIVRLVRTWCSFFNH